jgi:heavy metal translocating P-type ATPase
MSRARPALRRLCDHCGLPLPGRAAPRVGATEVERDFCCFGCEIAYRVLGAGGGVPGSSFANAILAQLLLAAFLSMAAMGFSLVLYADAFYPAPPWSGHPLGPLAPVLGWLAWGASTPAIALLAWPLLFSNAARTGMRGGPGAVNFLVLTGVLAAYALSLANLLRGEGSLYFDTAATVLLLVTLGRYLDARARARVARSVRDLLSLDPEWAVRVGAVASPTDGERVPVEALERGDTVRVAAGERVPADGVVTAGSGCSDESLLTGEAEPRIVNAGDSLAAGSLLLDGCVDLRVEAACGARLLDRMAALVDDARERRMPLERMSEKASRVVLPAALLLAAATFAGTTGELGAEAALLRALSVLLIACPCALGIATPLATWAAIGRAARSGTFVRGGEVFERLARPCRVFLDKTGTLTERAQRVTRFVPYPPAGAGGDDALVVAASLAARSGHPAARAVARHAAELRVEIDDVRALETKMGLGLCGEVRSARVVLGSDRLVAAEGVETASLIDPALAPSAGESRIAVAAAGRLAGAFFLREAVRPEAARVVAALRERGCEPRVLTGDGLARAEALAAELGVPVESGLLPLEKAARLEAAKAPGRTVVMVGDGVNDAPVLAAADVGIALAGGADISRETAEVVLLERGGEVLGGLVELLDLSRTTVRRVRFNLFWSFAYNTGGMLAAAAGWIHPVIAALLMVASSLTVVAGAYAGAAARERSAP